MSAFKIFFLVAIILQTGCQSCCPSQESSSQVQASTTTAEESTNKSRSSFSKEEKAKTLAKVVIRMLLLRGKGDFHDELHGFDVKAENGDVEAHPTAQARRRGFTCAVRISRKGIFWVKRGHGEWERGGSLPRRFSPP